MTFSAHIPTGYRVTFMSMDAHTPFNSRSTKWYHSTEEIPAEYRATIGVKYDSENPCMYHSGKLEVREAMTITHTR